VLQQSSHIGNVTHLLGDTTQAVEIKMVKKRRAINKTKT